MKIFSLLTLFVILNAQETEAFFLGNIFTSFGEWIKGIFVSIWNWILDLIFSIGKAIVKEIEALVQDIFAALSAAGEYTKSNFNATLNRVFGPEMFSTSKILIDLMYTGELPIQSYMESVDIEDEFAFLDESIALLRFFTFISLGLSLTFIFLGIVAFSSYKSFRTSFEKVKLAEMKYLENEPKRK